MSTNFLPRYTTLRRSKYGNTFRILTIWKSSFLTCKLLRKFTMIYSHVSPKTFHVSISDYSSKLNQRAATMITGNTESITKRIFRSWISSPISPGPTTRRRNYLKINTSFIRTIELVLFRHFFVVSVLLPFKIIMNRGNFNFCVFHSLHGFSFPSWTNNGFCRQHLHRNDKIRMSVYI